MNYPPEAVRAPQTHSGADIERTNMCLRGERRQRFEKTPAIGLWVVRSGQLRQRFA